MAVNQAELDAVLEEAEKYRAECGFNRPLAEFILNGVALFTASLLAQKVAGAEIKAGRSLVK